MKNLFRVSLGLWVTLVLLAVVVSGFWWATPSTQGWQHFIWVGAKAGLIGALVDWMALVMVFQKKWWIPFSGVIPRHKDELTEQIAETVEKEWLTPDSLRNYLKGVRLSEVLTQAVDGFLEEPHHLSALTNTLVQWADGKLSEDQTRLFLEENIAKLLPQAIDQFPAPLRLLGRGAVGLGLAETLKVPQKLAEAVLQGTKQQLLEYQNNGRLEQFFIYEIRHALLSFLTPRMEEQLKEGLIRVFCEHVKPGQVVRQHLSSLTAEDIRHMVESKARKHLEWIRVNGAIGGFLLGLLLEGLSRLGIR
jgi:uncharacterized membrane-anchored protein YjiN (DUF445 family)